LNWASVLVLAATSILKSLGWLFFKILEHWQVIVGLMGSDITHYMLDVATTEHKNAHSPNK
jgi:uncharacterized metal-binding protein